MKSFVQYTQLHEIGNRPYKWKRIQSNKMKWSAKFTTDKGADYQFDATKDHGNQWEIWFKLVSEDFRIDNLGVTGTEKTSAIRVLGTVKEIFENFVKQKKPQAIMFLADKRGGSERGSRAKLYDRFAKTFARENGYELETNTGTKRTEYYLYKDDSDETGMKTLHPWE